MATGEPAIFAAALNVCLSGVIGYGLYKISTVKGEATTATDHGRKWLAWMVAIGTLSTLPKFFRHFDAESLATWIVVVAFLGIAGFIAGWVYGKLFGIQEKTIQESSAKSSEGENMSHRSRIGKSVGIVILILAAVIGGALGREAMHSLFKREPERKPQGFLNKVASEVNKSLPMMIDRETELMNVLGLEATIVYNYRLLNTEASKISSARVMDNLKPGVLKAACSTPKTRDDFLKKGITLRYSYSDKEHIHIASFDVTGESCGF